MATLVAEIDLSLLVQNIINIKKHTRRKLCFVVKADAYSHGALAVAKAAESEVDEFAVATLKEALEVVLGGVARPINILGPLGDLRFEYENIEILQDLCIKNNTMCDIIPSICSNFDLFNPIFRRLGFKKVNIKVDTGMSRLGVHPNELGGIYKYCSENNIVVNSVFSHLYNAYDESASDVQLSVFNECSAFLRAGIKRHIAASNCTFLPDNFNLDMVRPGIAAYGYSHLTKPIMKIRSSVIKVMSVASGQTISYGNYTAPRAMRIALIRGGYADGVARKFDPFSCDRVVSVNGKKCPIIGQVCMDMTIVDVTNVMLKNDNDVYFLGDAVSAHDIAVATKTCEYEVLTSFKGRVAKKYI